MAWAPKAVTKRVLIKEDVVRVVHIFQSGRAAWVHWDPVTGRATNIAGKVFDGRFYPKTEEGRKLVADYRPKRRVFKEDGRKVNFQWHLK